MRRPLVFALLSLLTWFGPRVARAQDGLRVQAHWKIVGIAVATSQHPALPDKVVASALDESRKVVERELPGITWQVADSVRQATYQDDPTGQVTYDGLGLQRIVESFVTNDKEVAAADIVFVYAPFKDEALFGWAWQQAFPGARQPVWYAVVNTTPADALGGRAADGLSGWLGKVSENLPGRAAKTARRLLANVARTVELPPLRDLELVATTVHEYGHFLAPGTQDVRATTSLEGALRNGQDEPTEHTEDCVMWTPTARSFAVKLASFPRVIRFCDKCRERLGCPPVKTWPWE